MWTTTIQMIAQRMHRAAPLRLIGDRLATRETGHEMDALLSMC